MGLKVPKISSNPFKQLMDNLLGTKAAPDAPAPPPPPPAPGLSAEATPSIGVADEAVRDQEQRDAKLRRKGRAAYILGGAEGYGTPTTAAKTLTGE